MTISALLAIDRRTTARSMLAREATANTPGPLMASSRRLGRGAPTARTRCVEGRLRAAPIACSWASVSEPAAAVCATSSAALAVRPMPTRRPAAAAPRCATAGR